MKIKYFKRINFLCTLFFTVNLLILNLSPINEEKSWRAPIGQMKPQKNLPKNREVRRIEAVNPTDLDMPLYL
jgi:hypothetical protein